MKIYRNIKTGEMKDVEEELQDSNWVLVAEFRDAKMKQREIRKK